MTPLALLALALSPDPAWAAADAAAAEYLADHPAATLTVGVLPLGDADGPPGSVRAYRGEKAGGGGAAGDGLYELASVTKAFTGTLLAMGVAAGEIDLDEPVARHLPADLAPPTRDGRSITPLHLATHTSSLPVQPPGIGLFALLAGDAGDPYAVYRPENLALTLRSLELPRPIGSRFEYSNLGVGLLGHALAGAAGADDYGTLLRDRITRPLGLADTVVTVDEAHAPRCLTPRDGGEPTSPWTFASLGAAGAVRSTADDLLAFAAACLGRPRPGAASLADPFDVASQPWRDLGEDRFVGLGWHGTPLRTGPMMIWHNGGTYGSRSFLGLVPSTGAAVVVLVNEGSEPVDAVALDVLNALHGR